MFGMAGGFFPPFISVSQINIALLGFSQKCEPIKKIDLSCCRPRSVYNQSCVETSWVNGCCCMWPSVKLKNRIPFVSQTDALVLCRQRCGLHCWSCNPGNTVNKETCFGVFFHGCPPTRVLAEVKRGQNAVGLVDWVTTALCNDKSRRLESNLSRGEDTSLPDRLFRSRFCSFLQEVGTSDVS